MGKKFAFFLLTVVLILVLIILIKTFTFKSIQPTYPTATTLAVSDSAIVHLQQGIRFKTVSVSDRAKPDSSTFLAFHRYLAKTYPLIQQKLRLETVAGYSLVYTWKGKNPALKPVILMAHQDVVPVEKASLPQWKVDPFGGTIKDGKLWGRGSADDKISLFALLEATEKLLQENRQPERTIYFVFGHDEEAGGKGVKAVAALFKTRGIKADWVLDEGGEITKKEIPGLQGKPVALIGTSEKGYLSIDLKVNIEGGHSSMPKTETAIDVLVNAVQKLRSKPFPASFAGSTGDFFNYLGPEMPFTSKMAIANQWLFKPLLFKIYEKSAGGNALIRTTIAPTILQAGVKDNVIPTSASATINFRLLPGTSIDAVFRHVKEAINDNRVQLIKKDAFAEEASGLTSTQSEGFKQLEKAVVESYPGTMIAPYLTVGATDSRQMAGISNCILRFAPVTDLKGMHGLNEHIGVDEYKKAIGFYYRLMKDLK
ncbi:M20 family peptidase [Mucilaginibacter arboris]|uniref:M20/M25/M40 family metallo-hydrolase n=1 Tax=Mucilaginibacter arboris TaxID=2682090 RepID=A0A7K1SS64_9SPHI|nr:M20 family peptidase [Mucilaginibacter arboris]MVN20161.1 M20/M25/M40 family metallo-hydrolase [Mucilaginibacter arboris]